MPSGGLSFVKKASSLSGITSTSPEPFLRGTKSVSSVTGTVPYPETVLRSPKKRLADFPEATNEKPISVDNWKGSRWILPPILEWKPNTAARFLKRAMSQLEGLGEDKIRERIETVDNYTKGMIQWLITAQTDEGKADEEFRHKFFDAVNSFRIRHGMQSVVPNTLLISPLEPVRGISPRGTGFIPPQLPQAGPYVPTMTEQERSVQPKQPERMQPVEPKKPQPNKPQPRKSQSKKLQPKKE